MFVNRWFVLDDYSGGQNELQRAEAFGNTTEREI